MSVQIDYKTKLSKKNIGNIIAFVDDKFNISGLKKHLLSSDYSFISDLIKTKDVKNKILAFDINSKKKIVLISFKNNTNSSEAENLGAKFYDLFKDSKENEFNLNSDTIPVKSKNFLGNFIHGIKLKSYIFEKYKTKKNNKRIIISVSGKNLPSSKDKTKFKAIEEGTFFTRDLVSEPGNILHPDEYAKRLKSLKKYA